MQPLNDSRSRQVHRARMQAEQTVMARSRLRRDLRAFCLAPLPRSRPDLIGKGRLIEAAIGQGLKNPKENGGEGSVHWIGVQ